MGLQLNRGILPESIDVYLNDAIMEKTRTELIEGVRTALQDSVNTQAQTMSPINTFRNLLRTARYKIDVTIVGDDKKVDYYNPDNGFHIINIPTVDSGVTVDSGEYSMTPLMFLGFSIEYDNTLRGNPIACRLVGSDVLETTLRDYCNGASKDAPIVCLTSIPVISNNVEQIGVISNEQLEVYLNAKNQKVQYLNVKYIKTPNVVKFDVDDAKCVNCDLPVFTHFEIVERAVYKYYQSIGATTPNQTSQQRAQ